MDLTRLPYAPAYGVVGGSVGLCEIMPRSSASSSAASVKEIRKGVFQLSNDQLDVEVDNGVITSLYDKVAAREVIAKGGKANQFVIFDDKPLYFQAWDVEVFHLDSRQELSTGKTTVMENGPHRASILTETRISESSWIKTTISLSAVSTESTRPSYVELASEVEWHEDKKFLKVEFPVDVHNTEASYETQFGINRRPTHYNTTWDMAKFEVCCHKWADLSEAGYGVSILNDSKYGFATCGNLMRLSLLRAPKAPDAHADMGRHHINYAIMPHSGPLGYKTVRAAFEFNNPLATPSSSGDRALFPFTSTHSYIRSHASPSSAAALLGAIHMSADSDPAIVLDTIKRGEDDEDVVEDVKRRGGTGKVVLPRAAGRSVVLRLYDALGGRCKGIVKFGALKVKSVKLSNLLEDEEGSVEIKDGGFKVELRAFEVATFKLLL